MQQARVSEILLFTKYIAMSLKSGITLVEGLEMIWDQSRGSMKRMVKKIMESVKSGDSFYDALKKFPDDFSPIYTNMVKIGEASGTLEEALNQLANEQKKSYELKQKVKSAMMYPMLILVAVLGLGFSVSIFVLPKILPLFEAFTTELPTSTKVLMYVAKTTSLYGKEIAVGVLGGILLLIIITRLNFVKPVTHRIVLATPLVGRIVRDVNLERFTRTFGTLLKSAIPVDEGLRILQDSTENRVYKKAIKEFIQEVKKGNRLGPAFAKHENIFPKLVSKMISMGESTGNLDDMLLYLSGFYENEVDTTMKDLSTVLEPVLLIAIGLIVGGVAMAILGPIYKITASIQ